ncbi:hypothetical protein [Paracraurococcus lichenis]|uniref:Uncharacterized protein n=1 Tax=Paracraurococcus lichenis TaxID=3064888 RepID=A0ABT9E361_9PROT|nr:hypothetical protein [Paracraurococcus sp. LOR1-02]MDO9710604.1 hypothetical protein [Paracraurococcus sp. LOR1-02]
MWALDRAAQEADLAKAREVLSSTPLPPELVLQGIEPGEDHAGEPALWLVYAVRLRNGDLPDRARMRELARFVADRAADVVAAGTVSWPYVRMTEIEG